MSLRNVHQFTFRPTENNLYLMFNYVNLIPILWEHSPKIADLQGHNASQRVDRLFLVTRVGGDAKITQSSTVQIRYFTEHRGSKWLNIL